jgi:hypothetical protein
VSSAPRRPVSGAGAAVPRGVGLYLAGVQLLFALGWIVYVAYLPELAQQAGIDRRWVPWLLAMDQLVFLVTDLLVGIWSDRAAAVHGRIARAVLLATVASALAFLALPWVAPSGSPGLFIAVTLLWAATSSALRAPPLTLLGRHVARPALPATVALAALGLGLANAASPYLGLWLKGLDPRGPFVLAALSLVAVTLGMQAAERALAASRERAAAADAPPPAAAPAAASAATGRIFLAAVVLAALAFQAHVFVASAPLYRAAGGAPWLAHLLPVFWIGFNLALWPAGAAVRRAGVPRAMAWGAAAAALAVLAANLAPGLAVLVVAQLAAGAAWAVVLCSAFVGATALGRTGREGFFNGSLQSLLAAAALSRVLVVALAAPPAPGPWTALAAAVFAAVGLLVAAGLVRRPGWPVA